jgi:hypothetical protein
VAIDGFGGIGRAVLRSAIERDGSYARGTPAATLLAHVAHGAIVGGFILIVSRFSCLTGLGAIVVVGGAYGIGCRSRQPGMTRTVVRARR